MYFLSTNETGSMGLASGEDEGWGDGEGRDVLVNHHRANELIFRGESSLRQIVYSVSHLLIDLGGWWLKERDMTALSSDVRRGRMDDRSFIWSNCKINHCTIHNDTLLVLEARHSHLVSGFLFDS
jgi:hypothetical protein